MKHLDFAFSEKLNVASGGTIVLRRSVQLRTVAETPLGWGRGVVLQRSQQSKGLGWKSLHLLLLFVLQDSEWEAYWV